METVQDQLLQLIKAKLGPGDSLGHVLSETLHISMDAAYRRMRNETALTIDELKYLNDQFRYGFTE